MAHFQDNMESDKSESEHSRNYREHQDKVCSSDTDEALLSLYFTKAFRKDAINFHGEIQDTIHTHRADNHSHNEDFIVNVIKEYMPSLDLAPLSMSDNNMSENNEKPVEEIEHKSSPMPQTGTSYQSQHGSGIYSPTQALGTIYIFNVITHYSYDAKTLAKEYNNDNEKRASNGIVDYSYDVKILITKEDNEANANNEKAPSFIRKAVHGVMNVLFPDVGHPYLGVVLFMGLAMGGVFCLMSNVIHQQTKIELQNNPLQSLGDTLLPNTATSLDHDGEQELGVAQSSQYTLMSPKYYHDHCLAPLGNDDKKWPSVAGHRYVYNMDFIESLPVSQINDATVIADLHDSVINALSCQGFSHQKIDGDNELFYQGKPVRFVIKSLQDFFKNQ
jgi:hypothetical protein